MTFTSSLQTTGWGEARSVGGWKMKYMVIRTWERHVNGPEWGRKEKLESPVVYEENTQEPVKVLVPGLGCACGPITRYCIPIPAFHQLCPVRKQLAQGWHTVGHPWQWIGCSRPARDSSPGQGPSVAVGLGSPIYRTPIPGHFPSSRQQPL